MTPKWTEEEITLLLANRSLTPQQLVKVLKKNGHTRTDRACKDKLYKLLGTNLTETTKPVNFSHGESWRQGPDTEEFTTSEDVWEAIRSIRSEYQSEEACDVTGANVEPYQRILHMTDWHIPFERDDLIQKIIETEGDKDTTVVIGGDMIDCYAPSSWSKDKFIPLKKEYDIALEYLKLLSNSFKKVHIIMGNHEYRVNRVFMNQVNPSISFFVKKDILWYLSKGYRYDEEGNQIAQVNLPNVSYVGGHEPWYIILGKMLFCHPYFYKSGTGNTVRQAMTYMGQRADFDGIAIGHTHTCSKAVYGCKLAIETPCLASPLDYEKQPKMNFLPQANGYSLIYLDRQGRVDFNNSTPVYMGSTYYKKYFHEV